MSFGTRLARARKRPGLSQKELAERIGTQAVTIGRYERDEVKPSVEVAAQMAEVLEVSLDWLAGLTEQEIDRKTLRRVVELQKLAEAEREHIYFTLDAMLRDAKTRKAYAS